MGNNKEQKNSEKISCGEDTSRQGWGMGFIALALL